MDKHYKLNKNKNSISNFLLFIPILILSLFGILMVFDSSVNLSSDKYHFVLLQSLWVTIGLVAMIVIAKIDYRKISKYSALLMLLCILSLIGTILFGTSKNGATRWISIGIIQYQTSEIIKPILVIYLASWFAKEKPPKSYDIKERFFNSITRELVPFLSIVGIVTILVVLQNDLGTTIIIATIALGMYFIHAKGLLGYLNLVITTFLMGISGVIAILAQPYRLKRLDTHDALNSGYQINQILIAIGSGGLFGKGFTQSIQKKNYLVESTAITDSIFAVIAEEFGFLGCIVLISTYIFILYRIIVIAVRSNELIGKYIAIGIGLWIISQALLNIAVNVKLVPLTGVPLPFISYGGSSTISILATMGILFNITKQENKDK